MADCAENLIDRDRQPHVTRFYRSDMGSDSSYLVVQPTKALLQNV
jgi:hypothetical protein